MRNTKVLRSIVKDCIKGSSKITKEMDMAFFFGKTDKNIKEIGRMVKKVGMVFGNPLMETFMMDNGSKTNRMAKDIMTMAANLNIGDISKIFSNTVEDNKNLIMEISI
jgi:hypothetical protein